MNEEQANTSQSMAQTGRQATDFLKILWRWGKYLVPTVLVFIGGLFLIMLFVGMTAGSEDENCYTDTAISGSGSANAIGGDWKDKARLPTKPCSMRRINLKTICT